MEDQLKSLWSQVLDCAETDIEPDTDFFEAGGDSVAAIKLVSFASGAGIKLDAQTVFNNPTFSSQVEACTPRESSEKPKSATITNGHPELGNDLLQAWDIVDTCLTQCGISRSAVEELLPCTPYQRELMAASHNLGTWLSEMVFELEAGDQARVRTTFEIIQQKYAIFRTRIFQHKTDLYQVVLNEPIRWHKEKISLQAYKDRDLRKRMAYGDPLCRYAIIEDGTRQFFVWTMGHAIYDRFSKMHLLDDIHKCFRSPMDFSQQSSRKPFRHFLDFVHSTSAGEAKAFWKSQLQGAQSHDPLFKADFDGDYITVPSKCVTKSVEYKKPQHTPITFSTIAHVGWGLCLANIAACDDVVYPATRSCRQVPLAGVESIIGPLVATVPVRIALTGDASLHSLLHKVQESIIAGIPHEPFGTQALMEYFGHRGFLQSLLLVQPSEINSFGGVMEASDVESGSTCHLRSLEKEWAYAPERCGLLMMLEPESNKLVVRTNYDDRYLSADRVHQIVDDYLEMLNRIMSVGSWEHTTVSDLCPHLATSSAKSGAVNGAANGATEDAATLLSLCNSRSKDVPSVIIPGKDMTISQADLYQHIKYFQKELALLGITIGSAVSIALPNTYELIVGFLAATWQRGIAAPLNPGYKQEEFEFYIDDLGSSLVLIPKGDYSKGGAAVAAARKYKAAVAECYWDGTKIVLDVKEKGKMAEAKSEEVLTAQEEDIALVLHTSGTTGRPKAVPLTHKNLVTSIDNICKTYQLTPKDRTMLIMPLFHVHGLLASFLSPLRSGGAAIVPARLQPSFWEDFAKHKATWYTATPTMHRMIITFPQPTSMPDIRFIRSCSSQLSPALFHQLEAKFKTPILESYAMTEASHMMTSNPLPPAKRMPGCVGLPQGIELRILDDDDEPVEQGKEGEVSIRGGNVTHGYLNNEKANKSAFTKNGFFRTGDQGKLDEDGYLFLTGRLKEFINKGGEKISPVELDNVISQHEAVGEVVTFAIDDENYGQEVACAVKVKDGAEIDAATLKKWIRQRVAAPKVPKMIWFPDAIPKTATGKVQRKLVSDIMMKKEVK